MSDLTSYRSYATAGSLALSAERESPRLTVIKGGLASAEPDERRQHVLGARALSRGFLISALFIISLVFISGLVSQQLRQRALDEAFAQIQTQQYVVGGGDSLWSVAETHPVKGLSTQDVASYLAQENALSGSELSVGQTLQVPVEG